MKYMIRNKIEKMIEKEEKNCDEQSGFRKNKGGTDNICILKEIIDKAKKRGKRILLWLP